MARAKTYNYEKYSILDIKKYLESKGYKNEVDISRSSQKFMRIKDSDIYIGRPSIDEVNKIISASILFEDYPRTENFEKSKKLYGQLKRKFGASDEKTQRLNKLRDSID